MLCEKDSVAVAVAECDAKYTMGTFSIRADATDTVVRRRSRVKAASSHSSCLISVTRFAGAAAAEAAEAAAAAAAAASPVSSTLVASPDSSSESSVGSKCDSCAARTAVQKL